MSVLVKNMTFPEMCAECDFCGGYIAPDGIYVCDCPVEGIHGANITQYIENDCRHPDCPLVDVPTPHGRLVDFIDVGVTYDEDTGTEEINSGEALSAYLKMWIAPPVIEAEEKDED